jgi:hypothetical protein
MVRSSPFEEARLDDANALNVEKIYQRQVTKLGLSSSTFLVSIHVRGEVKLTYDASQH